MYRKLSRSCNQAISNHDDCSQDEENPFGIIGEIFEYFASGANDLERMTAQMEATAREMIDENECNQAFGNTLNGAGERLLIHVSLFVKRL